MEYAQANEISYLKMEIDKYQHLINDMRSKRTVNIAQMIFFNEDESLNKAIEECLIEKRDLMIKQLERFELT